MHVNSGSYVINRASDIIRMGPLRQPLSVPTWGGMSRKTAGATAV